MVFAQSVKFGLQTGVGFPSLQSKAPLGKGGDYKIRAKYQIGAYAEIEFKKFTLQPALMILQKGNLASTTAYSIWNTKPLPYEIEQNLNLVYLEMPVNALYNIPVKIGSIYIGAGPYVAVALSGNIRNKSKKDIYVKRVEKEEITFGNGDNELKSTDFGANLLGGLQLKSGINFGLNFGLGLTNVNNTPVKSYNRVASFRIGYRF